MIEDRALLLSWLRIRHEFPRSLELEEGREYNRGMCLCRPAKFNKEAWSIILLRTEEKERGWEAPTMRGRKMATILWQIQLNRMQMQVFGGIQFLIFLCPPLCGVIRNWTRDSPVWMVRRWEKIEAKSTQQAASGPIRILRALKPLCLIQFWKIPFPRERCEHNAGANTPTRFCKVSRKS